MESDLTKPELLRIAQEAGFEMSGRRLDDWIRRGLIAKADVRGLGKGRGVEGRWDRSQGDLLVTLLRKRSGVSTLGPLYNIPVFVWLHWGDDYVKLPQVRSVMRSWIDQYRTASSVKGARHAARQTVEQFSAPGTSQWKQKETVDLLIGFATGAIPFDSERLAKAASLITGPGSQPPADTLLALTSARFRAAQRFDSYSDAGFVAARITYIASVRGYFGPTPTMQANEELANKACLNLLTHLGLRDQPTT